ncbi:serine aminopeptidase domain-containing protein [Nocardioides marmoraquaticus]
MSAPLVLVAPAMAVGSRYYRPVLEAFREHGWEASALPRRGFEPGQPRASRRHDWSYADEVAVVTEAVGAARTEDPDRPVVLLGHSLGGQLSLAHQLGATPADGLVTVGGCLPHHVLWPWRGPQIALMGGVAVPVLTAVRGYLPPPAFGAPGARTLMREWGRMAVTGRTPFPSDGRVAAPSLLVSLEDDGLAPRRAVDAFADRFFEPAYVTRWHRRHAEVPTGASNDHLAWARSPASVVDRVVAWWDGA